MRSIAYVITALLFLSYSFLVFIANQNFEKTAETIEVEARENIKTRCLLRLPVKCTVGEIRFIERPSEKWWGHRMRVSLPPNVDKGDVIKVRIAKAPDWEDLNPWHPLHTEFLIVPEGMKPYKTYHWLLPLILGLVCLRMSVFKRKSKATVKDNARSYDYSAYNQRDLENFTRGVLNDVKHEGLKNGQVIWLSFDTNRNDVMIPDYMRQRYPDYMTIVCENQFENLRVSSNRIQVTLFFDDQPETLEVPLDALRTFHDPNLNFTLER